LEEWLSDEDFRFQVFPLDSSKRETFRAEFESSEAKAARNKDQRFYEGNSWEVAHQVAKLVTVASMTQETGMDQDGYGRYLGISEKYILKHRQDLGGIFASMIAKNQFRDLKNLVSSLENHVIDRKESRLRKILRLIENEDQNLSSPNLFQRSGEHDQSNFNKKLRKFGFGSLISQQE
jgi:hypothetical protein